MMRRCKVELLMFDDDGHQIDKRENRAVLTRAMCDWLASAFDPTRNVVAGPSP